MAEMDWLAQRFGPHRAHLRAVGLPDARLADRGWRPVQEARLRLGR